MRPAGSQNLSGSSGRQKNLSHYRESNLDSWVFEPVLMSHYAIRALRASYWTKNQILQTLQYGHGMPNVIEKVLAVSRTEHKDERAKKQ
jgi:hypothetical protein